MSRRPEDDRKSLQRQGGQSGRQEEQKEEKEETAQKELEPEHSRLQKQVGNQGVASLLAAQTVAAGGRGAAVAIEIAKRPPDLEKEGQDFGGTDDGDPFAVWDTIGAMEGWNPGTAQPSERVAFIEGLLDDSLPPEDEAFRAELQDDPVIIDTSEALDALLQPSIWSIQRTLRGWGQGLLAWAPPPLGQAWARLVQSPPPLLLDPMNQVLVSRTRVAALASLGAVASDALHVDVSVKAIGTIAQSLRLQLELEGRFSSVRAPRTADLDPKSRPSAAAWFTFAAPHSDDCLPLRETHQNFSRAMESTLRRLARLSEPRDLVPRLAAPLASDHDDDDPYGVEATLIAMTGGLRDSEEAIFRAIIHGAERLAAALQLSRLRFAGLGVAVTEVLTEQTGFSPFQDTLVALQRLDGDIHNCLAQLRELARAAQQRALTPGELTAKLDNVARSLDMAQTSSLRDLAQILASCLPNGGHLPSPPEPVADPLTEAWEDGNPSLAGPWLRSLAATPARDITLAWTEFSVAIDSQGWANRFDRLRGTHLWQPIDEALRICATACLLRDGQYEAVFSAASLGFERACQRRNGVVAAEAALTGTLALHALGHDQRRDQWRRETARAVHRLGAFHAVSLITRWAPPVTED